MHRVSTPLAYLPSGWRNNFYNYQQESFRIDEKEYTVHYRYLAPGTIKVRCGEQTLTVELHSVDQKWPVARGQWLEKEASRTLATTLDGLRRTWRIARKGDDLYLHTPSLGACHLIRQPRFPEATQVEEKGGYRAQMPAKVLQVWVEAGQQVRQGERLLVLESMKMETTLCALANGRIQEIWVRSGDQVQAGDLLLAIDNHD